MKCKLKTGAAGIIMSLLTFQYITHNSLKQSKPTEGHGEDRAILKDSNGNAI